MAQAQIEETGTQQVGDEGEIRISPHAMRGLRLSAGDDVVEFVIDGALVYLPAEAVVSQTITRLQESLAARGLTTEAILADLEAHKDELFAKLYPSLASST